VVEQRWRAQQLANVDAAAQVGGQGRVDPARGWSAYELSGGERTPLARDTASCRIFRRDVAHGVVPFAAANGQQPPDRVDQEAMVPIDQLDRDPRYLEGIRKSVHDEAELRGILRTARAPDPCEPVRRMVV
jgi:hypothetical protein